MTAVGRAARPESFGSLVLPVLAITYAVASVAVALDPQVPTTYGASSSTAAVAELAAGLGLLLAGVLVWRERPVGWLGPLATLLGVAWLAPAWVGWQGGSGFARSVAMVVAPFLPALLFHLVAAAPTGRLVAPAARIAVATVYGAAALYSVGRALVRDPFLDLDCWSNCTDNVFLIHTAPELARVLDGVWLRVSVAVCLLLVAFAGWRFRSATRPARAALWPVLLPAALAAGAEGIYALVLLREPAEDPQATAFQAIFLARALSLASLAAGVAWTVVRNQRIRAAISRLAADLGEAPRPGSLRTALARSLGDENLAVAYRLPGRQSYVDAEGRSVQLPTGGTRVTTPIVRNRETVALVIHDPAISGPRELEREIGAAARLAVDNERLRAEVLAQLEDLRSSRARIVEAGDAARRRIERDLHDGAQQRLLSVSYELRLAAAAGGDGERGPATALATARDQVQEALAELRELAHGIYPVILTEAGIGPALMSLADDAPLPVEVSALPSERFPEAVERAAYVVVAAAIDLAMREGADHVAVTARREGDSLLVCAGQIDSAPSVHLADRVGALGGTIEVVNGSLQVEIPCA